MILPTVCVCVFVCSCLSTEQDVQQSPFNKIRVKLPLTRASSSVIRDCLLYWKMFCLRATVLYPVPLVASTAGDLEFYSTATLTKKRQLIPRVIEDIL